MHAFNSSTSSTATLKQTAQLLRKVGKKLAKAAGCEDLPWEFHVIDAEEIMNAAVSEMGRGGGVVRDEGH